MDGNLERETWEFMVPRREFILVAAPMTGYPEFNLHEIRRVQQNLRFTGIMAYNPFAIYAPEALESLTDTYFRQHYLPLASHDRCGGVCALDGWEQSQGATTEVIIATRFGKPTFKYREQDGAAHLQLRELVLNL